MAQKKIELIIDVESSNILLERIGISQVINNLLDNAIRYYEGTDPITIKGKQLANEYKVSVTGPGRMIAKGDRERILIDIIGLNFRGQRNSRDLV